MSYRVIITPPVEDQILEQGRYIAVDCKAPLNAARWLERVFDAADTLANFPARCVLAVENGYRDYEIRRLTVGDYLLLFTIVEEERTVWIIGFRHGSRLPRPMDLPPESPHGAGDS